MRGLSSSVVVLTTSAKAPGGNGAAKHSPEHNYRGMTLSSFTSLSLSPPLITFNIRAPSRTLSALKQSGVFLIHVLEANREGATVADSFTKGNADGVEVGETFRPRGGSFQVENTFLDLQKNGSITSDNNGGLPKLVGKGIKRVLACELHRQPPTINQGISDGFIEVGEHVLVVAKVISILSEDKNPDQSESNVNYGLSYVDGRYRAVGETIMVHDTRNDIGREPDSAV